MTGKFRVPVAMYSTLSDLHLRGSVLDQQNLRNGIWWEGRFSLVFPTTRFWKCLIQTFTFLKFLYMELAIGLSEVILPLRIWDMMLPRVTIPITDLMKRVQELIQTHHLS